MTKPELGGRRRCLTCDAPFFDLNRTPIVCPKCGATFTPVEIAHSPPRRVYAKGPRLDPVVRTPEEGGLISPEAPEREESVPQEPDEDQELEPEHEAVAETEGEPDVS